MPAEQRRERVQGEQPPVAAQQSGESLRLDPDTARCHTAISPVMTRDARLDTSGDISC